MFNQTKEALLQIRLQHLLELEFTYFAQFLTKLDSFSANLLITLP